MALENGNGTQMYMPVAPAGYGGNGFGGFGGDGWWIILLLLCGWGGFGGMNNGAMGGGLYPWLDNSQNINDGFRDQMLNSSIQGIQSGIGDLQTALCGGFAGVNATVNGAAAAITQQLNTNEIANLNRSFAEQTANAQNFSGLQAQLAQCCCDNRLATCQTQNILQSEAAANRAAIQAMGQTILDKMCQDKIDEKNEKIVELQNRLNMADFAASQASQNNYLQNALTAQTQYFLSLYPPARSETATTPAAG